MTSFHNNDRIFRYSRMTPQDDFTKWVESAATTTREDIKTWLKTVKMSRNELAERLKVSKGTVNNWLSGADPIPKLKLAFIESLMQSSQPEENQSPATTPGTPRAFAVQLSEQDYQRCLAAALRAGKPNLEAWAAQALTEAAFEQVPDASDNDSSQIS